MIFHSVFLCLSIALVLGQEASPASNEPNLQIIGGEEAGPEEAKFAVYVDISRNDSVYCGGTLIDRETVLTAANCFQGANKEATVTIKYGTHNIKVQKFPDIQVEKLILHPNYTTVGWNDLAILKLANKVVLNKKHVSIAKLPKHKQYSYEPDTEVTAYGWGRINLEGDQPDNLMKTTMKIIQQDTLGLENDPTRIMAQNPSSGICNNDNGAPLIADENVVIGIDSWGSAQCLAGVPEAYTKVESFLEWIESNMVNVDDSEN